MVKKLFALASVTALTGLVTAVIAAGCSSTEYIYLDGGASDARREASRPPDTEEAPAATCKAETPFVVEDIKPAAPRLNVCDDAQIGRLATACAVGTADPNSQACADTRAAAENQGCADCIFGSDADAEWKVVNVNGAGTDRPVRYNQAGCIEYTSQVKDCGEALLTLNICINDYCDQCADESELQTCVNDVLDVECTDYRLEQGCYDAFLTTHKDEVDACFAPADDTDISRLFTYMAKVACQYTGAPDGGTDDGGTDPGTDAGEDAGDAGNEGE